MKKMMKFAAIAVVASLALVACKNNKVEEPIDTIDSTAIEQVVDEIADSVIDTVDLVVVEEPAPAVKKTVKKAEKKGVEETGLAENPATSKQVAPAKTADEMNTTNTVKRQGRR